MKFNYFNKSIEILFLYIYTLVIEMKTDTEKEG